MNSPGCAASCATKFADRRFAMLNRLPAIGWRSFGRRIEPNARRSYDQRALPADSARDCHYFAGSGGHMANNSPHLAAGDNREVRTRPGVALGGFLRRGPICSPPELNTWSRGEQFAPSELKFNSRPASCR
jgi:hypothetical protein